MSTDTPAALQTAATDERTDLEPRDVRALTEAMVVLPEGDAVYTVIGEHAGGEYTVDADAGTCTCPDAEYNLGPTEQCKHERRVAFETGGRAIPDAVDATALDDQLGAHVDATPTRAVADGGELIVADDDGEVLTNDPAAADDTDDHFSESPKRAHDDGHGDGDTDSERPDDCQCAPFLADADLPCWPCYRDGFRTPADDVGGDEKGGA
jgi:hypothetical protein